MKGWSRKKRFPLLISITAAVVWLLPVVGPFVSSARAEAHKAFDLFVEIKPSRQDLTIPPEVIAGIQFVDGVKEDAA